MDLQKAIRELYEEKVRIDGAIAALEERLRTIGTGGIKRKRGRKSMGVEERREMSARMRSYWAARRTELDC